MNAHPRIIRPAFLALGLHALLLTHAGAQLGQVPLMRPEEAEVVENQAREFFNAIRPAARDVAASTVWVWADNGAGRGPRLVSYGTVVGDGGKVLTKWSEIALAANAIQIVTGDGTTIQAKVAGVYQDEDLALLTLVGRKLTPIDFTDSEPPKIGKFLVAASPEVTPVGVGVVAVEARSLRIQDQAFLGIRIDPEHTGAGVAILDVEQGGAAEAAGFQGGDVILAMDGRSVDNLIELQTVLAGRRPGDALQIRYRRGNAESSSTATLQRKGPAFAGFPNGRLRQMEAMGAREKALSVVRDDFPSVIQTDLRIGREQCGGPVVDLDGAPVGIVIARADRTRSFVIPASYLAELLAREPDTPEAAIAGREQRLRTLSPQPGEVERPEGAPRGAQPRVVPAPRGAADNLRRHLQEMERLMERMRREMEGIED